MFNEVMNASLFRLVMQIHWPIHLIFGTVLHIRSMLLTQSEFGAFGIILEKGKYSS